MNAIQAKLVITGMLFISLLPICLHSQVTIGDDVAPISGALLDLKNQPDGTSTLGLGLPRVVLSSLKPMTGEELAQSIGNPTGDYSRADHIGLVVYNIKEAVYDPAICKYTPPKGIYVWEGTEWQQLGAAKASDKRTITDDGTQVTISYKGETTSYRYSKFGDAGYWMTENLATMYLPDGTSIPKYTANSTTDPQYYIPGNKPDIQGKEGLLYNWAAVMNKNICSKRIEQGQASLLDAEPGDNEVEKRSGPIQGICPAGWHVPSDREWNELEREITTKPEKYTQTTSAGSLGWTSGWETLATMHGNYGKAMANKGAIIESTYNPIGTYTGAGDSKSAEDGGFDALMTGHVTSAGIPNSYGVWSYFWSASDSNNNSDKSFAWRRLITDTKMLITRNSIDHHMMHSLRCKKNK